MSEAAAELAQKVAPFVPRGALRRPELVHEVAARWCERQRCWHGPAHLLAMIEQIEARASGEERNVLLIAAIYHDAVYDPRAAENEEASAQLLRDHAADATNPEIVRAAELISASKWQSAPADSLTGFFFELDTFQLSDACSLQERLEYERAIFREYQWVPLPVYRAKRAEFLQAWAERFPQHRRGVAECLELLRGLRPRIAVYPGSFNPFHLGHLSVLRQAERAFDKVIVAIGVNRQKAAAASVHERHEQIAAQLRFHEVAAFEGLLPAYLDQLGAPATIVRGVRNGTDLEAELRYARFLNDLRPGTDVIWIGCDARHQHLSSSAIRELESIEPGAGARYVPRASEVYGLRDR